MRVTPRVRRIVELKKWKRKKSLNRRFRRRLVKMWNFAYWKRIYVGINVWGIVIGWNRIAITHQWLWSGLVNIVDCCWRSNGDDGTDAVRLWQEVPGRTVSSECERGYSGNRGLPGRLNASSCPCRGCSNPRLCSRAFQLSSNGSLHPMRPPLPDQI